MQPLSTRTLSNTAVCYLLGRRLSRFGSSNCIHIPMCEIDVAIYISIYIYTLVAAPDKACEAIMESVSWGARYQVWV